MSGAQGDCKPMVLTCNLGGVVYCTAPQNSTLLLFFEYLHVGILRVYSIHNSAVAQTCYPNQIALMAVVNDKEGQETSENSFDQKCP